MDGTLAQIITDLLQSQQALVQAQQRVEALTKQIDLLTKERDALKEEAEKGAPSPTVQGDDNRPVVLPRSAGEKSNADG